MQEPVSATAYASPREFSPGPGATRQGSSLFVGEHEDLEEVEVQAPDGSSSMRPLFRMRPVVDARSGPADKPLSESNQAAVNDYRQRMETELARQLAKANASSEPTALPTSSVASEPQKLGNLSQKIIDEDVAALVSMAHFMETTTLRLRNKDLPSLKKSSLANVVKFLSWYKAGGGYSTLENHYVRAVRRFCNLTDKKQFGQRLGTATEPSKKVNIDAINDFKSSQEKKGVSRDTLLEHGYALRDLAIFMESRSDLEIADLESLKLARLTDIHELFEQYEMDGRITLRGRKYTGAVNAFTGGRLFDEFILPDADAEIVKLFFTAPEQKDTRQCLFNGSLVSEHELHRIGYAFARLVNFALNKNLIGEASDLIGLDEADTQDVLKKFEDSDQVKTGTLRRANAALKLLRGEPFGNRRIQVSAATQAALEDYLAREGDSRITRQHCTSLRHFANFLEKSYSGDIKSLPDLLTVHQEDVQNARTNKGRKNSSGKVVLAQEAYIAHCKTIFAWSGNIGTSINSFLGIRRKIPLCPENEKEYDDYVGRVSQREARSFGPILRSIAGFMENSTDDKVIKRLEALKKAHSERKKEEVAYLIKAYKAYQKEQGPAYKAVKAAVDSFLGNKGSKFIEGDADVVSSFEDLMKERKVAPGTAGGHLTTLKQLGELFYEKANATETGKGKGPETFHSLADLKAAVTQRVKLGAAPSKMEEALVSEFLENRPKAVRSKVKKTLDLLGGAQLQAKAKDQINASSSKLIEDYLTPFSGKKSAPQIGYATTLRKLAKFVDDVREEREPLMEGEKFPITDFQELTQGNEHDEAVNAVFKRRFPNDKAIFAAVNALRRALSSNEIIDEFVASFPQKKGEHAYQADALKKLAELIDDIQVDFFELKGDEDLPISGMEELVWNDEHDETIGKLFKRKYPRDEPIQQSLNALRDSLKSPE